MKIAVDIDDTLNIVDRVGRASAYIERKGLDFHLQREFAGSMLEVFDWKEEDVIAFLRDGGIATFTEADARKGAKEALEGWRRDGHEVVIVTARDKEWFGNAEKVSRDWLEKRKIPYDELVAEIPFWDKGAYCHEHGIPILVDDSLEACLSAQNLGVYAVLAVGKHNVHRAREIRYGGANWRQLDATVRHLLSILK